MATSVPPAGVEDPSSGEQLMSREDVESTSSSKAKSEPTDMADVQEEENWRTRDMAGYYGDEEAGEGRGNSRSPPPSSSRWNRRDAVETDDVEPVTVEEFLDWDSGANGKKVVVATASYLSDRRDWTPRKGFGRYVTRIRIGDDEAAFILGKGGRTKSKIARVSGATVTLTDDLILELSGPWTARKKAELYVKLVIQQRRGLVVIDLKESDIPDLSIVDVPPSCVAFVTGQQGRVLRSIEHEWNTLMFFCRHKDDLAKFKELESATAGNSSSGHNNNAEGGGSIKTSNSNNSPRVKDEEGHGGRGGNSSSSSPQYNDTVFEKLVIFGDTRGRKGAELKVISAIEQKERGRYSRLISEDCISTNLGFDTDMVIINEQDFSYSLGKDGATRKKLAKASHCVLEYVGRVAFIAGTFEERQRCREYLDWLIRQRAGPIHVETEGRNDVTVFVIPSHLVKVIAGPRGITLRKLEGTSNTFCFLDAEKYNKDFQRLLIFSFSSRARKEALDIISAKIDDYVAYQQKREADNYQSPPPRGSNIEFYRPIAASGGGGSSMSSYWDRYGPMCYRGGPSSAGGGGGPSAGHRMHPYDGPPSRSRMYGSNRDWRDDDHHDPQHSSPPPSYYGGMSSSHSSGGFHGGPSYHRPGQDIGDNNDNRFYGSNNIAPPRYGGPSSNRRSNSPNDIDMCRGGRGMPMSSSSYRHNNDSYDRDMSPRDRGIASSSWNRNQRGAASSSMSNSNSRRWGGGGGYGAGSNW